MDSGSSNDSRPPITAIALAALTSVALWSLKPIFISMIGDRGDYAEVYVAAATISVAASALAALLLWRKSASILRGGRVALAGAANAAVSGLCLALWYYGFYRALYESPKADATVIAFTWPLIAAVVMPILSPSTAPKLKLYQWFFVGVSFLGAITIAIADSSAGRGDSEGIVWAFVAAIGSGLYLPFAIRATNRFDSLIASKPTATFYAISLANTCSLAAVLIALRIMQRPLRFYAFDGQVVFICTLIGIGTYLVAEITWTWAFQEYKSLTLSSLPYFAPAISVVLLHVFFNEPVAPIAVFGLVVILISNLSLHAGHRTTNALSLTVIASVYVALSTQVLPVNVDGPVTEMAAAMTGLFAILSAFILTRAADRRTTELDARSVLVQHLTTADRSKHKDRADLLLRQLMDLEFENSLAGKEAVSLEIRSEIDEVADAEDRRGSREAFSAWFTIHLDRLSTGELAALWITGLGSVLLVLLMRGSSIVGNAAAVAFAAGCFLVIFTIRDYDRNNIQGFKTQLWRLEQGFREIGKKYYAPRRLFDTGELTSSHLEGDIRTVEDGEVTTIACAANGRRSFNAFYLSTAAIVIVGAILLPLTSIGRLDRDSVLPQRPQAQTQSVIGDTAGGTITIANPGWAGAEVIARVLQLSLAAVGSHADVKSMENTDAIAAVEAKNPSVQILPDLWLQNQAESVSAQIAAGTLRVNRSGYQATQGVYVLDDERTRRELRTWNDLANPDVAQLFDIHGSGNGDMWLGQRGWSSTSTMQGWLDRQPQIPLVGEIYSETIFKKFLADQAAHGRPALFYAYEPDWIFTQYPLRQIAPMPKRADCVTATGHCSAETVDVHVAWSSSLAALAPKAITLLTNVHFDVDEVSRFIESVDHDGQDPADVARDWVAHNRAKIAEWTRPR